MIDTTSQAAPASFGPFRQDCTLDGVLIRVGGRDDTVSVHLYYGGTVHRCNATHETARRLAPYLNGCTLRVHGSGRWERLGDGKWLLRQFDIKDFETLDDRPLTEVVAQLRSVPGSPGATLTTLLRNFGACGKALATRSDGGLRCDRVNPPARTGRRGSAGRWPAFRAAGAGSRGCGPAARGPGVVPLKPVHLK